MSRFVVNFTCALLCMASVTVALAAEAPNRQFLAKHCLDCHTGKEAEAGLDLTTLGDDLTDPHTTARWVRMVDRVAEGEMPPAEYGELSAADRAAFLTSTSAWLQQTQLAQFASQGRVRARRLTNLQLEGSLHSLLGIDIPLAVHFPSEPQTNGYNTVADGQPMSHFQMEQHLAGVDRALEEAYRRALSRESDEFQRELSATTLSRVRARSRTREPEVIDGHGVVWSSGLVFYGRIPATTARENGWYQFTIRAKGLNLPSSGGVWCTVRRGRGVSSAPLMDWVGAFEAKRETQEWTYQTWLPAGEMIEIRPGDVTLRKARFAGGQVGTGEGAPQNVPGVAIESIKIRRVHRGPKNSIIAQTLFGDLEINAQRDWRQSTVNSKDPRADATRLVTAFAERAFRRPVTAEEVGPYVQFALASLEQGEPFADALRGGYRAVLCSPRFMYFQEMPGQLDGYALASRLSYFLWNQPPDDHLLSLAANGKLSQPEVLRSQAGRMLTDPKGSEFMQHFADQWLDLSLIDFTEPDRRLYSEFDIVVQQSMLEETYTFLQTMLQENLSVAHLIDSDFTFLNSRLARYYELPAVKGDTLQRVSLAPDSPRGGLLGQGAILKVTANGTTTSPVIRGVWVSERLLGRPIPEPPSSVPAIEPDIRGANSIRDQLDKHKSEETCASCHRHIDPPGFALENFDPAGNWRERYGARGRSGAKVDPSNEFADGRHFSNIQEFRQLVLQQPELLARNVAQQLLTYGTGAPVAFADRAEIDRIVEQSAAQQYGLQSILEAAVTSRLFLNK